jgi:hypothetical protein
MGSVEAGMDSDPRAEEVADEPADSLTLLGAWPWLEEREETVLERVSF